MPMIERTQVQGTMWPLHWSSPTQPWCQSPMNSTGKEWLAAPWCPLPDLQTGEHESSRIFNDHESSKLKINTSKPILNSTCDQIPKSTTGMQPLAFFVTPSKKTPFYGCKGGGLCGQSLKLKRLVQKVLLRDDIFLMQVKLCFAKSLDASEVLLELQTPGFPRHMLGGNQPCSSPCICDIRFWGLPWSWVWTCRAWIPQ